MKRRENTGRKIWKKREINPGGGILLFRAMGSERGEIESMVRKAAEAKQTKEKKEPGKSRTRVRKAPEFVTELDQYLFGQGTHYDIFKKLGAHPCQYRGKQGMYFAVWAPTPGGCR